MERNNNVDIKKKINNYLRNIKKVLYCNHKTKVKYINDMKINIEDYLSVNTNANYNDIIEHFGRPDTIAKEFASQLEFDYIKKRKAKKILNIAIIIFLVTVTVSVAFIATVIIKNSNRNAGYYYDETISDYGIISEH